MMNRKNLIKKNIAKIIKKISFAICSFALIASLSACSDHLYPATVYDHDLSYNIRETIVNEVESKKVEREEEKEKRKEELEEQKELDKNIFNIRKEEKSNTENVNENINPIYVDSNNIENELIDVEILPYIPTDTVTNFPVTTLFRNQPDFNLKDYDGTAFENYSELDSLGRVGQATAMIGKETMPTGAREGIGMIKPTGWHTVKYDCVNGKYLYNRCHLIGWQLSAENANEKNLFTGTRYLNTEGMLPYENLVTKYINATGNHVLYRVTPYYSNNNLLVSHIQIEAMSYEDNGAGVCFNVKLENMQPGIHINYVNGDSYEEVVETTNDVATVGNISNDI